MVDLQTTNRVKISKVRETTFGVTPTSPVFKTRRVTSHGLATNPQDIISNEIRSDRQVVDLILTGYQAGGPSAGEASFQTMDEDIEEALQGTWATKPVIAVTVSDTEISDVAATTLTVASALGSAFKTGMLVLTTGFTTAANNNIVSRVASSTTTSVVFPSATFAVEAAAIPVGATARVVGFAGVSGDIAAVTSGGNGITSSTLDFTTLGLAVGEWVRPNNFTTAVDNDFCRISAIAAHKISFDRVPVGWVADAGTSTVISVYMGDLLTNGSTKRSNTFERQYLDHSPVSYEYHTGQTLDKLAFTADAGKILTYTEDWMGATGSVTTTRASGASDIAAPTNDVLNAASNVGRIGFDGASIIGPNFVKTANWQFANNLRRQEAVANLGAIGIGNGEFTVTGTLNTYFGDKTVLDKILDNSLTSFDIRVGRSDSHNESYVFDFPSIKLSAGSPSVSGKNADVMISAGFTAFMDATLGWTASVGRFWYLP